MHSFLDRVVSKVCRGCQWNSSVFDDRPRSWYRCRSCVLDGLLGSVYPIVFNGFNHFSRRQHHSSHCVRCSFKFLRKHVRLSSHVPGLVISLNICYCFFFFNLFHLVIVCRQLGFYLSVFLKLNIIHCSKNNKNIENKKE